LTPSGAGAYTPYMLKLRDLKWFKEFLESGGWADAFQYASPELRMEMIELVEALLETADVADRVVADVLFSPEGIPGLGETTQSLEDKGKQEQ